GVFLSKNADRAFTLGSESMSTWDGRTGQRLRSVELPRYRFNDPSHSYSPDGRYAVSFSGDGKRLDLLVWDIVAGRVLHTLRPSSHPDAATASGLVSCAFTPDSSLLATWHPGTHKVVLLWDLRTGKQLRSFTDTKAGWPGRMAFSPDGKT